MKRRKRKPTKGSEVRDEPETPPKLDAFVKRVMAYRPKDGEPGGRTKRR